MVHLDHRATYGQVWRFVGKVAVLASIVLILLMLCGCSTNLYRLTAQTADVVATEASSAADAWHTEAVEAEQGAFGRKVDKEFARITPDSTPEEIADVKAQIVSAVGIRDREMQTLRTRRSRFGVYMDMLRDIQRGYDRLADQGESLKAWITGQQPVPGEIQRAAQKGE